MVIRKKSFKKKRPLAVSVIALAVVVLFLIRLYQVFEPLFKHNLFQQGITGPLYEGLKLTELGSIVLSSAIYLILSLTGLVVLVGFLRLRRWSWVLLMAWTGISLIITLVDYFYTNANYAVMAANVIIAFSLSLHDVQREFKIRRSDGSSL
jgi:hypothetical protein